MSDRVVDTPLHGSLSNLLFEGLTLFCNTFCQEVDAINLKVDVQGNDNCKKDKSRLKSDFVLIIIFGWIKLGK